MRGAHGEIGVDRPAAVGHRPVKLILHQSLDRPGRRPRAIVPARIEVDRKFRLEMEADEGGVGHHRAIVFDEGQLTRGRPGWPVDHAAIGQPHHLQLRLGLHHEGPRARQAESRREGVERIMPPLDRSGSPVHH